MQTAIFTPSGLQDWRTEIIQLNDYKDDSTAVIMFQYISDLGGAIYFDNVRFDSYDVLTVAENNEIMSVYIGPNPASEFIYLKTDEILNLNVQIYSIAGIKLYDEPFSDRINISSFQSGVYFLKLGNKVLKFVKI
jgi:hypothetical protein